MRRATAVVVGFVLLTATACWPQLGQGPDRRSYNPLEKQLTVANVASLFAFWKVELPKGSSPPVVTTRGVYVTSDFDVRAFDADGVSRWVQSIDPIWPADRRGLGTPLVREDTDEVLVPASTYGASGIVGRSIRTFAGATGAPGPSHFAAGLATSLRGSRLATSGLEYRPAGQGALPVLRVQDLEGGALWGGFGGDGGAPTLGTDGLYVVGGTNVSRYDVSTPCPEHPEYHIKLCEPVWRVTVDGGAQPVVIGEDRSVLFVATAAGTLYALSAATGATLWTASVGSGVAAPPALAQGVVYVPTTSGSLAAVSAGGCGAATCPVSWRGSAGSGISAQPAVAGGVVYTGSSDGALAAFPAAGCGASTCGPLWTNDAGGSVRGLAVAFGSLYVGSADGLSMYRANY